MKKEKERDRWKHKIYWVAAWFQQKRSWNMHLTLFVYGSLNLSSLKYHRTTDFNCTIKRVLLPYTTTNMTLESTYILLIATIRLKRQQKRS